jgi:DNA topoisomerase-1
VTNFGRFGPYVKHNDEFRSLESDDDVFNISLEQALAPAARAEAVTTPAVAQKKTLKELTNNGTTVKLLAGRYGPYVTDGTTNASVPKGAIRLGHLRAGDGTARGAAQRRANASPCAPGGPPSRRRR